MYFYSIISCRLFKLMCIVSVCLTMSVNIISHLFILINFSIAYMSSCLRFIKINISYRHAVHCIAIVPHHYIHSVNRLFPPHHIQMELYFCCETFTSDFLLYSRISKMVTGQSLMCVLSHI